MSWNTDFGDLSTTMAKPAAARLSTETAALSEDEDEINYWDEHGWVPLMKSGKQRSPNMIRNELQKYIDNSSETQTAIVQRMGVNNNSFRKFMNPKTYKDQWSAIQNGTYWAAARLLEAERNKPKSKSSNNKRSRDDCEADSTSNKKSKSEAKTEMMDLIQRILAVQDANTSDVYDSCPEVIKKIKNFLKQDGITKQDFCEICLGGVNNNALNRFLASKHQDQAANQVYQRAYGFFEKKRILEGTPKSKPRIKNESQNVGGFALTNPNKRQWVYVAAAPW